jgi:hypothetical protein
VNLRDRESVEAHGRAPFAGVDAACDPATEKRLQRLAISRSDRPHLS